MASKEAQINVRLSAELDAWVESRVSDKREKPEFVHQLLEGEHAREEEERMLKMFNAAWESLTPEERAELSEEREDWTGA